MQVLVSLTGALLQNIVCCFQGGLNMKHNLNSLFSVYPRPAADLIGRG